MKIAFFDTIAGISGDMTLGAMIHAGLPIEYLRTELGKLGLQGFEIEAMHVERNGITAVQCEVSVSAVSQHGRHLSQILDLISGSALPDRVKKDASDIFSIIGAAEAKIHNVPVGKIHFHEVGAVDSIVDIVGAAIGLHYFGTDAVYSTPVKLGMGGTIPAAHGTLPVPAPATIEILRGYPVVSSDIPYELTTPTGAAIIKTLSSGLLNRETFVPLSIGYGSGQREMREIPNILRLIVAEYDPAGIEDEIISIETNIDDMNPEIYPHVIEKLLDAGARDAYLTPVVMKKGRPGILLTVLAAQHEFDAVLKILQRETTTIGIRYSRKQRKILERSGIMVETEFGKVRMKEVTRDGGTEYIPEYEECKKIADSRQLPLIEVYRRLAKRTD